MYCHYKNDVSNGSPNNVVGDFVTKRLRVIFFNINFQNEKGCELESYQHLPYV